MYSLWKILIHDSYLISVPSVVNDKEVHLVLQCQINYLLLPVSYMQDVQNAMM